MSKSRTTLVALLVVLLLLSACANSPAALREEKCPGSSATTLPTPAVAAQTASEQHGGQIAFESNGALYLINVDGTNRTQITDNGVIFSGAEPAWSPDGQFIAFASSYNDGVYVIAADGSHKRHVSASTSARLPAWSPDGQRIAYSAPVENAVQLFTMCSDGSLVHQLTYPTAGYEGADNWSPAWSPDGQHIVFLSELIVVGKETVPGIQARIISPFGDDNRFLAAGHWDGQSKIAWSPDGQQIAFASTLSDSSQICLVDADGSNRRCLTDAGSNRTPSWSPDGTQIVFSSRRPPASGAEADPAAALCADTDCLFLMKADGSDQHPLLSDNLPVAGRNPAWNPR